MKKTNGMTSPDSNPHIGSSFDEWLTKEGLLEEAKAVAKERVSAFSKELKTVNNVFIQLWSQRSSGDPYDKKEKRLWMLLQKFIESKGARQAPAEDYKV